MPDGYCLLLSVAKQGHAQLEAGWVQAFIRRRFFRIYPAYSAGIVLRLIRVAITGLALDPRHIWTNGLNHFSAESVGSHIHVIHNVTR